MDLGCEKGVLWFQRQSLPASALPNCNVILHCGLRFRFQPN